MRIHPRFASLALVTVLVAPALAAVDLVTLPRRKVGPELNVEKKREPL